MLRLISFFMTLLLGIIIAPVVYKAIREHQETHGQRIVSDLQDAAHQAAAALQPKPDQQQRIAANLQNAAHQIVGALQSKFAQNAQAHL